LTQLSVEGKRLVSIMAKRHKDWRAVIKDAVARVDEEQTLHKQDRSRQRRAEILAAALRVFAREGIARARINDIASEAGVPSASIYDYFDKRGTRLCGSDPPANRFFRGIRGTVALARDRARMPFGIPFVDR
jgi:hypothetical protein